MKEVHQRLHVHFVHQALTPPSLVQAHVMTAKVVQRENLVLSVVQLELNLVKIVQLAFLQPTRDHSTVQFVHKDQHKVVWVKIHASSVRREVMLIVQDQHLLHALCVQLVFMLLKEVPPLASHVSQVRTANSLGSTHVNYVG